LTKLSLEPGSTSRVRQNLALALGLKGDHSGMARVARADLDDTAIAENQKFIDAVRRLSPRASDTRTGL
jgi:Flp pilus assembly protein TadD